MVMDARLLVRLIILFPFFSAWVSAEHNTLTRAEIEKEILKEIYMANKFHTFIRPEGKVQGSVDAPVIVRVSMYVLNIDVDTVKQEYNIQMYFRQEWNDTRLAYNGRGVVRFLSSNDATGLWTPDLFFVNEKNGHFHAITRPNVFIRIYPDGRALYSQRLSMTLSCPMNLQKYPFDRQICFMPVESYGYTMNDIVIKWKENDKNAIGGATTAPGFTVSYYASDSVVSLATADYSRLMLEVHLTRLPFGHVFHIYLPISLFVLISWATFWMNPESTIPRMTTSVIATVCTLLQVYSNNGLFVSVSYPTALDVWVVIASICVFGALFENIYISCYRKKENPMTESGILNAAGTKLLDGKKNESDIQTPILRLLMTKLSHRIRTMDVAIRIFLPAFFILFNLIYFIKLTVFVDYEPLTKGTF